MNNIGKSNIPFSVIAFCYIFGGLSLFLSALILLFNVSVLGTHHFQPSWLASVHLLVLGFVTTIIYGAAAQIIPVITEVENKKFPSLIYCLFFHCTGSLLLVFSFLNFSFSWFTYVGALFVLIGALLFIRASLLFITWSKSDLARDLLRSSFLFFILTILLGIILIFNLTYAFLPLPHLEYLPLHALLGLIGWVFLLFSGVGSKLLPMFLLSPVVAGRLIYLKITFWLINAGLGIQLINHFIIEKNVLLSFGALVVILCGLLSFLYFLVITLKKRLKKKLDWSMKQTFFSLILILVSAVFFIVFSENTDVALLIGGTSFIYGFLVALLLGQSFKTLPFLRWVELKKTHGLAVKVQPQQLYSDQVFKLTSLLHLLFSILFPVGLLLNNKMLMLISLIFLCVGALTFIVNIFRVVQYKILPDEPGSI